MFWEICAIVGGHDLSQVSWKILNIKHFSVGGNFNWMEQWEYSKNSHPFILYVGQVQGLESYVFLYYIWRLSVDVQFTEKHEYIVQNNSDISFETK